MSTNNKPIANPLIVLREEFDDWAILFDPDSGKAFGLNPTSVFIWKCIDGKHEVKDIVVKLRENCEGAPPEAEEDVKNFIDELNEKGFVGYEPENNDRS
jgi:SynChlorMet cassette protein ScmD